MKEEEDLPPGRWRRYSLCGDEARRRPSLRSRREQCGGSMSDEAPRGLGSVWLQRMGSREADPGRLLGYLPARHPRAFLLCTGPAFQGGWSQPQTQEGALCR